MKRIANTSALVACALCAGTAWTDAQTSTSQTQPQRPTSPYQQIQPRQGDSSQINRSGQYDTSQQTQSGSSGQLNTGLGGTGSQTETTTGSATGAGGVNTPSTFGGQNASQSQNMLLNLSGATVVDQGGQQAGRLENVIVSPGGCIDMAVIALDANRLIPVPWQIVSTHQAGRTIQPGAGTPVFHLQVDRAKLQQAPAVQRAQLVNISQQQQLHTQIYQHFGVQARSAVGASSQTDTTQGTSSSTQTDQNQGATGTIGGSVTGSQSSTNQWQQSNTNNMGGTSQGSQTQQGIGSNTNQWFRQGSTNQSTNAFGGTSQGSQTQQGGAYGNTNVNTNVYQRPGQGGTFMPPGRAWGRDDSTNRPGRGLGRPDWDSTNRPGPGLGRPENRPPDAPPGQNR